MTSTDSPAARQMMPIHRLWCFRVIACLFPLMLLAALELFFNLAGLDADEPSQDSFVEFTEVRPLFELTADGTAWHTASSRRRYFREDSFSTTKPKGEFRIFVFGGSTVQGNPFSIETSFPTCLQTALEKADPSHPWKVVNCGGVSYATYRLVPVMQECLRHEPDLFIFCGGHNEFLEDVSYASVQETSAGITAILGVLNQFRTFRLVRAAALSAKRGEQSSGNSEFPEDVRPLLTTDVDTLLDHDGGFAAYHRDDTHAASVVSHFRSNLQRMSNLCGQHHVPLLLILPPSNLSDCPPFKPEFSESVSESCRSHISELLKQARQLATTRPAEAIAITEQATLIDPRYALAWYELGHLQFAARDFASAEQSFRRARDEDICPLRMTSALEETMLQVVDENRLPFLNAHDLLKSGTQNGIMGDNILVDHVHPSFRGHEEIAIAIAEWMISAQFASATSADWKEATRQECRNRLQSLDNLYFLRGRRHLQNLKLWAAGRSGGPPLNKAMP